MENQISKEPDNEVTWAELQGVTRTSWLQLTKKKKELIFQLKFIRRFDGFNIFFDTAYPEELVAPAVKQLLEKIVGSSEVIYHASTTYSTRRTVERIQARIREPNKFRTISFGSDVAERDERLLNYFISTKVFERVNNGQTSVVIGPKGSGKTAILKAIQAERGTQNTIVITPEVFATSMLREVLKNNENLWDEEQTFTSTWIFTILIEVFKRLSENPRGVQASTLKKLRLFLRDNANYQELDLFTRFIGYLKKIEGVKVGPYELTLKTKMLQELYSLAPLYEIVPGLRGTGGEIFILLDELDQGWDNTPHANRFISSLLHAAIKIQNLGLKVHFIAFIRSEIFDLIKDNLDQLDKLRSSIDTIKWTEGELSDLIVKRILHSIEIPYTRTGFEPEIASSLFDGTVQGMNGFHYILSRTSLRPREVLQFVSHAHRISTDDGQNLISLDSLRKAEEDFSSWKLDHIVSEYTHIFPGLKDLIWMFRSEGPVVGEIDVLSIFERYHTQITPCPAWAELQTHQLLQLLFNIEFLGIPRPQPARNRTGLIAQYEFAYERRAANVRFANSFLIHPAFWSVLEITGA